LAAGIERELNDATQQLRQKQAARLMQDDASTLRSALGNVTRHLSARDPAWCVGLCLTALFCCW
jgi:hypothetical protein